MGNVLSPVLAPSIKVPCPLTPLKLGYPPRGNLHNSAPTWPNWVIQGPEPTFWTMPDRMVRVPCGGAAAPARYLAGGVWGPTWYKGDCYDGVHQIP
jgi:hypothetical protein